MEERIIEFMKAEHINAGNLADKIHVQRSSISHILSGRNKPSFDFISKFLEVFPHVNAEWFITGRGKMYKSSIQASLFAEENGEELIKSGYKKGEEAKSHKITEGDNDSFQRKVHEKISFPKETRSEEGKISKIIVLYDTGMFEAYNPGK